MASFTQLTYHVIFSTKYRDPLIVDAIREDLYKYIGGTIRGLKGHSIEIGGVEDHVHLLANFSPTLAVSDTVRDVKANASRWLNDERKIPSIFEWQKGYSAFTVSYSQREAVQSYIRNQKEHHRMKSFEEEYIEFLKRHDIAFDMRYLFEAEHNG